MEASQHDNSATLRLLSQLKPATNALILLVTLFLLYNVAVYVVCCTHGKRPTTYKTISFPQLLWRRTTDLSLTLADHLFHVGLTVDAPLIKVNLTPWGGRYLYFVRSTENTAVLQSRARYLNMFPITDLCIKVGGLSTQAAALVRKNQGDRKIVNAHSDLKKPLHHSLQPGVDYELIAAAFRSEWFVQIESLRSSGESTIDLYEFISRKFVPAVSFAFWGDTSPYYQDPTIAEAWLTYNGVMSGILCSVMPRKLFGNLREGLRCRDKVIEAVTKYYCSMRKDDKLLQLPSRVARFLDMQQKWGFTDEDLARLDLTITLGLFDPPINASYGLLVQILSRPTLLAQIREELENILNRQADGTTITIHAHKLRYACPLLLSSYFETLRLIGTSFLIRQLAEDVTLDGCTLRKGNLCVLAGAAANRSPEQYPDPDDFKPDRFLGIEAPYASLTRYYRSFGSGTGTCSGRVMAPNFVLTTVASLILGFDIEPTNGKWAITDIKHTHVPEAVTAPRNVGSRVVKVSTSKDSEGVQWLKCDCEKLETKH